MVRNTILPLLLLAGLALPSALRAETGAARYAAVQLSVAEGFLQRARRAADAADYARAGKLAWQAGVDARLTWAMSDSPRLREKAAEVAREAAKLIQGLTTNSPDPAAASYRSPSGLAQADAPSRR